MIHDAVVAALRYADVHYFSKPYPTGGRRISHGLDHAYRTVLYADLFNLLSMKFLNTELDDTDLVAVQIGLVFHDAGREDDGIDRWEQESVDMFKKYMMEYKGLFTIDDINLVAKAMLTKDALPTTTLQQRIIHDADSLDMLRFVDRFDKTYLYFYRDNKDNVEAMHTLDSAIKLLEPLYDNNN